MMPRGSQLGRAASFVRWMRRRYSSANLVWLGSFAADASWNNWQGFLLEPLGLGTWNATDGYWEGNWAYANLGVLLALVLSFVVTYLARRTKVARQEERA